MKGNIFTLKWGLLWGGIILAAFGVLPIVTVLAYDAETTCNMNIWTRWKDGKCVCNNEGWVYVAVDGICVEPKGQPTPVKSEEKKEEKKEVKKEDKRETEDDDVKLIMNDYYSRRSSDQQNFVKDNDEKLRESLKEGFKPMEDAYQKMLTEQKGEEVSIDDSGKFFDDLKNQAVDENYQKQLQAWNNEMNKAENNLKLKAGVNKDEYLNKLATEKALKEQLAVLNKEIGFNHQRVLESTGVVKYDFQSAEYKKRFKTSAEDTFNGASNAVEFDKATRNINGMMEQSRDIKKALAEKFPDNWKSQYLDVGARPSLSQVAKETGSIWDVLLKQKLNK